jgi:hypothetical protein
MSCQCSSFVYHRTFNFPSKKYFSNKTFIFQQDFSIQQKSLFNKWKILDENFNVNVGVQQESDPGSQTLATLKKTLLPSQGEQVESKYLNPVIRERSWK